MADIRINALPLATGGTAPSPSDNVAIDGLTTRKTPLSAIGDIAVPVATQAEAEAGTNPSKRMTPLTTAQAIAALGATAAQGIKADTALQPSAPDSQLTFLQAGVGAAARITRDKNRDFINVLDFGAKGNGSDDDAPAINSAIELLRSLGGNVRPELRFGSKGGSAFNFKVNSPINMTGFNDAVGINMDLGGCLLIGGAVGKPIIDMMDSQLIKIKNGGFYSPPSTSNYGIQLGRAKGTALDPLLNGRTENHFSDLFFGGDYTGACYINSASEITKVDRCSFRNSSSTAGNATVIMDAKRAIAITSDYVTITQPNNTQSSFNDNIFTGCTFEKVSLENPATGYGIKILGTTRGLRFESCYGQNEYGSGVFIQNDQSSLFLDIHWEVSNLKADVEVDTSVGVTVLRNFHAHDYAMFCSEALIKGSGGSGNVFWIDSKIDVPVAESNKPLFSKNGATFRYHGEINLGAANGAGTYNLSMLDALNGDVNVELASTSLTLPNVGAYRVTPFNSVEQQYRGNHRFYGSTHYGSGANLTVSSGVLTIPRTGDFFYVSGGGNITSLAVSAADAGRKVYLTFGYSGTLSNSVAGKTVLKSSYSFATNNAIELRCDGSLWSEVARSENVAV